MSHHTTNYQPNGNADNDRFSRDVDRQKDQSCSVFPVAAATLCSEEIPTTVLSIPPSPSISPLSPLITGEAMGMEVGSAVEISEPLLPPEKTGELVHAEKIPPWREQITVRGLLVSTLLGALFCIITHKLNLTVGVIPSLNVAAGLLGFFFVKSWTELPSRIGVSAKPFTRQENTVIQTCVVACYGLAFSGNC